MQPNTLYTLETKEQAQLKANSCYCSGIKSCPTLWPHGLQYSRLPYPSRFPRICSNSYPLSRWCYPTTFSAAHFSSCLQSFPASGSFPTFCISLQSVGTSTSVIPINIQDWFPLGLTGLIPLLSKGLPKVFPNTTVQKNQLFGTQPSLGFNPHICTWLLEN